MVSRRGLISHQRMEPTRADQILAADHWADKLERRVFLVLFWGGSAKKRTPPGGHGMNWERHAPNNGSLSRTARKHGNAKRWLSPKAFFPSRQKAAPARLVTGQPVHDRKKIKAPNAMRLARVGQMCIFRAQFNRRRSNATLRIKLCSKNVQMARYRKPTPKGTSLWLAAD